MCFQKLESHIEKTRHKRDTGSSTGGASCVCPAGECACVTSHTVCRAVPQQLRPSFPLYDQRLDRKTSFLKVSRMCSIVNYCSWYSLAFFFSFRLRFSLKHTVGLVLNFCMAKRNDTQLVEIPVRSSRPAICKKYPKLLASSKFVTEVRKVGQGLVRRHHEV